MGDSYKNFAFAGDFIVGADMSLQAALFVHEKCLIQLLSQRLDQKFSTTFAAQIVEHFVRFIARCITVGPNKKEVEWVEAWLTLTKENVQFYFRGSFA